MSHSVHILAHLRKGPATATELARALNLPGGGSLSSDLLALEGKGEIIRVRQGRRYATWQLRNRQSHVKPIKTLADAMEYYQGKVAECDEKIRKLNQEYRKEALKCAAATS